MNDNKTEQESSDKQDPKPADPKPTGKTYERRGHEKQKGGLK